MNLTAAFRSSPPNANPVCYPGSDCPFEPGDWIVQGSGTDADFGMVAADGSVYFELGGAYQDLCAVEDDDTSPWTDRESAEAECMKRRAQS
tara:strand:+ start:166 stop:438 length:273 start_codon:yes stop_codon:yes gene_type:complete